MPRPLSLLSVLLPLTLLLSTPLAVSQNIPLPSLPYAYDALEPIIDETTMRTHHLKHHAGYTRKLNAALSQLRADAATNALAKEGVDSVLRHLDAVPSPELRLALRNNGGGYVNHELYFNSMRPPLATAPAVPSPLSSMLAAHFGSLDDFLEQFTATASSVFGSGWAWLSWDDHDKRLIISSSSNQDSPAMEPHLTPLLALDLWEHAYYLQYKNDRSAYVKQWTRLINWDKVNERLHAKLSHAEL